MNTPFRTAPEIKGTIGPESKFYGYIVGLAIGYEDTEDSVGHDQKYYALFHYGNDEETWIVPDAKLFKILSDFLNANAHQRDYLGGDCFGNCKLWIEQKDGKWIADLP